MREIIMLVSTTKTPKGRRTRRPAGVAANMVAAGFAQYVDAGPEDPGPPELFATERAAERADELKVEASELELGGGTAAGGRWGVKDIEAYAKARDEAAGDDDEEGGADSEASGADGDEGGEAEGSKEEEEEAGS